MMSDREFVLNSLKSLGKMEARRVQENAPDMDGTALNGEADYIPDFRAACAKMNMNQRKAGAKDGFVCRSTAGRVVRLLQVYDSSVYPGEPEELPAQWAFVWSTNPDHALPFISLSTSPYNVGDCCLDDGVPHRSTIPNNIWRPTEYPQGWELA